MNQNDAYLQALGIPQWVPREVAESDESFESAVRNDAVEGEVAEDVKADIQLGENFDKVGTTSSAVNTNTKDSVTNKTEKTTQSIAIKALVNHPEAKFVLVVPESLGRNELQLFWKQIKFAWLQWHDQDKDFPASLFQVDTNSDYLLENIQQQNVLLVTSAEICQQETSLELPNLTHKKALWQLLQTISEKVELL